MSAPQPSVRPDGPLRAVTTRKANTDVKDVAMRGKCFYLGTHETSWVGRAGVPLFISHRRLARLKRTLPKAIAPFALDSGGFSELSLFGGWRTTPLEYVQAVVRYDREIGKLDWAASQDWMNEPDMLARTGLTVREHQRRTVANYIELVALWDQHSDASCPFMPTVQGYLPAQYRDCLMMYADAGVDLGASPIVGVGSVCRRQHTDEIRAVLEVILEIEPEIELHGFGVKHRGLAIYGDYLTSFDSTSWSINARKNPRLPGCTHVSCSNCMLWALRWRRNVVGGAWCSRHGEWCQGFGGGYCGDFIAPEIGCAATPQWMHSAHDRLAG